MNIETWTRRELERWALAARRAAACFAFAAAWVGAWMLGVWWLGASLVYAGPAPTRSGGSELGTRDGDTHVAQAESLPETASVVSRSRALASATRPYPFDERSRVVSGGKMSCPELELTEYAGQELPLVPAARVAAPFRERLQELERVVKEQALEFYGRAPNAILIASSYDCRSVKSKNQRLSEHALGNAIDITGFRFDALGGAAPFEVRVDRHWRAKGGEVQHERFLHALTESLITRDVFRTLLGPAHPDHADHFHFDMAPHPYVDL